MFKKKFDTINATIFILFLTVFGLSFITLYKDYQKRNLEVRLELTNRELQDTQGDRDYYKSQYQKYFELSEELQNQMGVYAYE
jgi:hypothetical protein